MTTFSITYDLRKPGQNYQPLWDRLKAIGAVKVEESQWILKHTARAIDIANDLLRLMDANDRLLVAEVGPDCAWYNLIIGKDGAQKVFEAAA